MKYKTALVCIAKNEDNYLDEWIQYNLKIGFSDIFIYQNNWRFKSIESNEYPENVHFEILDGNRMQNKCYNDFIEKYNQKYDWVSFLDVDEFVYLENGIRLDDWLASINDQFVVYVHWRLFGDNDMKIVENGEYSVIRRFTKCGRSLHRLGKYFLHTSITGNRFIFNNPHIIIGTTGNGIYIPKYSDPSGVPYEIRPWEDTNRKCEQVEIYHFRNKTIQENIERKFKQDDAFHDSSKCDFHMDMDALVREFKEHNMNDVQNLNLLSYMK